METTQKKRRPNTAGNSRAGEKSAGKRPAASTARKRPASTGTRSEAAKSRKAKAAAPSRTAASAEPAGTRRTASARRTQQTAASARRKRTSAPVKAKQHTVPAPEVVYTPAKPFNRSRLLLQLTTVVAVVLALSFGISIFFKVDTVTVSGNDKYDAWTVKEASGIEEGDNLLSFGKAKAAGKIKTALPYVESVRIGIKLPDTVNIEIKELDVMYSIKDAAGNWWVITSDGRVVDRVDGAQAGESAKIEGVKLASPAVGQQAVAYEEPIPTNQSQENDPTDATAVPTAPPQTARDSDKLAAALSILQYLEECGIIGEVTNVDVSDLGNLELKYGQRFTVKLGDTTQLLYKIKCMNAAINGTDENNSLKEYDSGVLDVSFTIKENQVIYQATD